MFVTVEQASAILKTGGVVVFPTETVYGLGALASDRSAVEKIYEIKKRPKDNPLICHFYSIEHIENYVTDLSQVVRLLFTTFSPGPLSILLRLPPNSPLLPATRGSDSVICRIPDHPLTLQLIKNIDKPLAAPSANTSGKMSGTMVEMITADLGPTIPIIDGGQSVVGIESTIIDARQQEVITILRPGIIGQEELQHVIDEAFVSGKIPYRTIVANDSLKTDVVPGSKYRHYSPKTPVFQLRLPQDAGKIENILLDSSKNNYAFLASREFLQSKNMPDEPHIQFNGVHYLALGSKNNISEISHNLYYLLYKLDTLQVSKAFFIEEEWGESSVSQALKNRLAKIVLPF